MRDRVLSTVRLEITYDSDAWLDNADIPLDRTSTGEFLTWPRRIKLILLPSTCFVSHRHLLCEDPLPFGIIALHRWIEPYPIINDRPFPSSLLFPSNTSSSCFLPSLSLSSLPVHYFSTASTVMDPFSIISIAINHLVVQHAAIRESWSSLGIFILLPPRSASDEQRLLLSRWETLVAFRGLCWPCWRKKPCSGPEKSEWIFRCKTTGSHKRQFLFGKGEGGTCIRQV